MRSDEMARRGFLKRAGGGDGSAGNGARSWDFQPRPHKTRQDRRPWEFLMTWRAFGATGDGKTIDTSRHQPGD